MIHVFVITSESRLANALERYYKSKRDHFVVTPIIYSEEQSTLPLETFCWIAGEIERHTRQHKAFSDLRDAVAILDVCDKTAQAGGPEPDWA